MELTAVILVTIVLCTSLSNANRGECGSSGGLTSGTLRSPNHPSHYRPDQTCSWTLSVERDYLIKLTFHDEFDFEGTSSCDYDYVEITDIHPVTGETIQSRKYCGDTKPGPYRSTSPSVRVSFKSDGSNEFIGFALDWAKIDRACEIDLEGESGVIKYPHDEISPETWQCSWNISVRSGKIVHLQFDSNFDLGAGDTDTHRGDTIQILDVMGNGTAISRGSWSGTDHPPNITSFGSKLTIILHREGPISDKDFSIKWRAERSCSGIFDAPEGYIMSFNYPNALSSSYVPSYTERCEWQIDVPSDYRIVLSVHHSMNETDCHNLQMLDYVNDTLIPHRHWCNFNTTNPDLITSDHFRSSASLLKLVHQYGNTGPYFFASWRTECGQTMYTLRGIFTSPGYYGTEYPPSEDCEWIIEGVKDHVVRLEFHSIFDIETANDGSCGYDYVEVFDSSLVSHGRFCGTQAPPQFVSSSQKIMVRFHSDQSKQGKGFAASWDTTCGDVYTSLQGNITSPWFPSPYPDNFDCKWEIQVPDGYTIQLTFSEPFSLEENTGCEADFLEVYDYTQTGSLSKRGRWCGQNMPPFQTSLTSRMQLVFHSDGAKNHFGFQAEWTSGNFSSFGCGVEFHSPKGTFTSPGFPQPYPDNLRCRWEIHATQGQRVKLDFGSTFDLEVEKDDCSYDSVEVRDSLPNGKLISYGKWCSFQKIPVFYSMSKLVVLFYSDTEKSGQGFSASWESEPECGGTFIGKAGHLLSPNYPSNYPENKECRWEIVPTPDVADNVTLHFDQRFDLESDPECAYDYVEIRQNNRLLGRWCGSDSPPDVTSGGHTLMVIFKSDKSVTGKGFLATLN